MCASWQRQMLIEIKGKFFRATDPSYKNDALVGSVRAGRYSRENQSTLYLSSSIPGVVAALGRYDVDIASYVVHSFRVCASSIFDLRDHNACSAANIDRRDALVDWQQAIRSGDEPASWQVADKLRQLGANGLIDPSRKAPKLWHLVLFCWNSPGCPQVVPLGTESSP